MNHNLSKNVVLKRLAAVAGGAYQVATAVDGAAVDTGAVDTMNYDGVLLFFIKGAGTNANVLTAKVQQSSDNGSADAFADVAGTAQTITDVGGNKASKVLVWDLYKPQERYLRLEYQRTTQNSAIDGVFAILYRGHHKAADFDLTGAGQIAGTPVVLNGPVAGTA